MPEEVNAANPPDRGAKGSCDKRDQEIIGINFPSEHYSGGDGGATNCDAEAAPSGTGKIHWREWEYFTQYIIEYKKTNRKNQYLGAGYRLEPKADSKRAEQDL